MFVAALLPQDGGSLESMTCKDADAQIGPHLKIDKARGLASVEYSARADLFANGAPEAVRKAIPHGIVDEPLGPLATPVHVTAANFGRSEEHTSELQSLMRISYAVFCLKKKINSHPHIQ